MRYVRLGRTGLHVSPLCMGTMMFGAWDNTDHDDSVRIIHAALDASHNFVDTADVYSASGAGRPMGEGAPGTVRLSLRDASELARISNRTLRCQQTVEKAVA